MMHYPLASCFASLFGPFLLFSVAFLFSFGVLFLLFLRLPFNLVALSTLLGFAWHLAELL